MDRLGVLVVIAPARRAGDPGSNPGPGEKFFLLNYFVVFLLFSTVVPASILYFCPVGLSLL